MKPRILTLLCSLAAVAAIAQTSESGGLLRDKQGMTLYTFDKDSGSVSNCYDGCAAAWPPFLAADGAKASGKLGLHARKDGRMQWLLDGKPLYYFAGDQKPGEANGDGSGGVWHVIRAASVAAEAARPATNSSYSAFTPYNP